MRMVLEQEARRDLSAAADVLAAGWRVVLSCLDEVDAEPGRSRKPKDLLAVLPDKHVSLGGGVVRWRPRAPRSRAFSASGRSGGSPERSGGGGEDGARGQGQGRHGERDGFRVGWLAAPRPPEPARLEA
jgi:hypothetical protein